MQAQNTLRVAINDANGNMTTDGTKCYHYNEANQLDKVTKCSNSQTIAEYVYDLKGDRMVKKNFTNGTLVNTVTSWSDSYETKVIEGGATENTAYYFANGQLVAKKDKDGNRTYVYTDHLGSTSVIANQSGGLVESTSYDPWGEVKSGGTKSKFLYTGQEKDDETGLHYYNARYYAPEIRRFTQPDDVIEDIYNPQMLNRYSYVKNNPLRYTDPTGHCIGWLTSYCGQIVSFVTKVIQPVVNFVSKVISSPKTQQVVKTANKVQSNPVVQKAETKAAKPASNVANTMSKTTSSPVVSKALSSIGSSISKTTNNSQVYTNMNNILNPVKFSSHATDRMEEFSISQESVLEALAKGTRIPGNSAETSVYQLSSDISTSGRGIRVVINDVTNNIITVTDKGSKYNTK